MTSDDLPRPDKYRAIARQLRVLAFEELNLDICRRDQLLALSKGFDRFADRLENHDRKMAAD